MIIQPGDVLFVWGNSLIDKGIEIITHGPSHCAMFVNTTELEEAQRGRSIGEIDLSFYLGQNIRLEVWGDPTLTDGECAEMVTFAYTLYGKNYDNVLIPLELLHFECGLPLGWYHNDKGYICSGDVDTIARHENRLWSKVPNPAPVDLLNGGVLKFKYRLN